MSFINTYKNIFLANRLELMKKEKYHDYNNIYDTTFDIVRNQRRFRKLYQLM